MAELLKGAPVAAAINARVTADIEMLRGKGIEPCLAIVQLGNNDADTAYANGAKKKCAALSVAVKDVALSAEITWFIKSGVTMNMLFQPGSNL